MTGPSGLLVLPPVELRCGNDVENVTIQELKEMGCIVRTTVVVVTKRKIAILESLALHTKVYLINILQTKCMFVVKMKKIHVVLLA